MHTYPLYMPSCCMWATTTDYYCMAAFSSGTYCLTQDCCVPGKVPCICTLLVYYTLRKIAVFQEKYHVSVPVLRSRSWSRLEQPLLGWSQSRFFCWPEPRARAAFFKAAPAPAASFRQAKKENLVVVTKHD